MVMKIQKKFSGGWLARTARRASLINRRERVKEMKNKRKENELNMSYEPTDKEKKEAQAAYEEAARQYTLAQQREANTIRQNRENSILNPGNHKPGYIPGPIDFIFRALGVGIKKTKRRKTKRRKIRRSNKKNKTRNNKSRNNKSRKTNPKKMKSRKRK